MIREICWDSQLSVRTGDLLFLLLEPDPSRDQGAGDVDDP